MKKIIIVGGGIAGLSAGIYLRANGYAVDLLEKNPTIGGACIGWERKGFYIDGCIHWLSGVNKKSPMYQLWKETNALSNDTPIIYQNDLIKYKFKDGKEIYLWADIDKCKKALYDFAPEDKRQINKFFKLVKKFQKVDPPSNKPVELMNIFDLIKVAFTLGGLYPAILKTSALSCEDYSKRFKNKYLRELISTFMAPNYNFMSMLYMLGHISNKDGGIPEGGSFAMSERMEKRFIDMGGNVYKNTPVSKVVVKDGVAKGVLKENGEFLPADWVVCTTPVEHCLLDLLDGKFTDKKFNTRLSDQNTYPIYTYTFIAVKCPDTLLDKSLSICFDLDTPITMDCPYNRVAIRNYGYDKTLKRQKGYIVLQATVHGNDDMYFWWKDVKNRGEYAEYKRKIANQLLDCIKKAHPDVKDQLEIIDTVTPCTYERYLNSRHGSFQGFIHTSKGKALMHSGKIKGLKNFLLAGQWLIRSGGLPTAVMSGKFSAQRICKKDKIKFTAP